MATFPRGSLEEDVKALSDIVNPIDTKALPRKKVAALVGLSKKNEPRLLALVRGVLREPEVNCKKAANIAKKAKRPSVKDKYPWFDVEHIRDALRFRSCPETFEELAATPERLRGAGLKVVKIDLSKLTKPSAWGWRFAGADFRMPDLQLVEFYATFKELMDANNGECHKIFEKWRNRPASVAMQEAMELSDAIYERAWAAALERLGLTNQQAERRWAAQKRKLRGNL